MEKKQVNFLLLTVFLIAAFSGWGQTIVSYTGMGTISCPTAPTATIQPAVTGLTFSQMSRGSGVSCASASTGINGSAFNVASSAVALGANKYYTFSVTSNASTSFYCSALSIVSQVSSGTASCDVQYDIDGGTKNPIGSFTSTTTTTAYPISFSTISIGASQVLNIYIIPYNTGATGTTVRVNNTTSITVATSNDMYRSKQTGSWNATSTWEVSADGGSTWSNAVVVPEYTRGSITIQSPHTVTITANLTGAARVDGVTANSGATLILNSTITLQLADGPGVDLKVLGTFTDRSTSGGLNNATGDGTWELGSSGTYIKEGNSSSTAWKDSYEGGISTIPAASNWTVRQTAASVFAMSSTDMYYGNLTIENTSGGAWSTTLGQTFLGSSSSPVIKGNLDIGGSGANAVNFVNANTAATPVLVKGNLTVRSGSTLNIGSSTESCSGITVYSNVQIDGSLAYGTTGNRTLYLQGGTAQSFSGAGTISIYNFEISGTSSVTLAKTVTVANAMTITDNSSLDLQSFNLNVAGRWTGGTSSASTVTGTGSVILNGNSLQQLSGKTNFKTLRLNNSAGTQMQSASSFGIYTALELQAGTFAVNSQTLTFYSQSVSNYACLNNFTSGFSGDLTGNITAQVTVPSGGVNQHFLGSPVSATLSQFGASGTAGYVTPLFVSGYCTELRNGGGPYGTVFTWEEDKALIAPGGACPLYGWKVLTSGSAVSGQGYSVYLSPGTFAVSGSPTLTSPVSVSGLANTGYSLGTTEHTNASTYTSGWHLLANPYLSPYKMREDIQDNLSANYGEFDDLMVWVASGRFSGTYQSLVSGGFNSNMLAPFQGVMVHRGNGGTASTPQTATPFVFNKNYQTIPGTLPQFTRQISQGALSIEIAGNGYEDITYVEFRDNMTSNFDIGYDSRKMVSAVGQPTIFTLLNGEFMSSNVNPSIEDVSAIPLNVSPGANGTFTFTFNGINTFDPTSYVYLEDKVTGAYQNVRSANTYTFTMNQADSEDRFVLHFTPAAEISTTDASCNSFGMININQPGPANWNYLLTDNNGFTIAAGTLSESTPVTVVAANGIYTLTLTDLDGYTVIQEVQITGAQPIAAAFSSNSSAEVDENITFISSTPNADIYHWDLGDGTIFNNQLSTINHQYQQEGVYVVSLTVTNQEGCSSTTTRLITVTSKTISGISSPAEANGIVMWSEKNKVSIDFSEVKNTAAAIDIYNILGQRLCHDKFYRSGVYSKSISNFESGYVIVRVKNDEEVTARKLFISNK